MSNAKFIKVYVMNQSVTSIFDGGMFLRHEGFYALFDKKLCLMYYFLISFVLHRQFDLRCTSTSTSAPNNILVNLTAHTGQAAEAKCLAINPLRPEMLAVGANDPYVRLYDRRMLKCCHMKISADGSSRSC